MTARFDREDHFEASAERLLSLLINPDFQRERSLAFGASRASCRVVQQSPQDVILELVETTQTAWGQHDSTMTIRWDLPKQESKWQRVIHGLEKRSRAEGWLRIVDEPEGCRLVRGGEVEVRVPVIGRVIERKVVAGLDEAFVKEAGLLRERLRDAPTESITTRSS